MDPQKYIDKMDSLFCPQELPTEDKDSVNYYKRKVIDNFQVFLFDTQVIPDIDGNHRTRVSSETIYTLTRELYDEITSIDNEAKKTIDIFAVIRKTIKPVAQWFNHEIDMFYRICWCELEPAFKLYFKSVIDESLEVLKNIDKQKSDSNKPDSTLNQAIKRRDEILSAIKLLSDLGDQVSENMKKALKTAEKEVDEIKKNNPSKEELSEKEYETVRKIIFTQQQMHDILRNHLIPDNFVSRFEGLLNSKFPYRELSQHFLKKCEEVYELYGYSAKDESKTFIVGRENTIFSEDNYLICCKVENLITSFHPVKYY